MVHTNRNACRMLLSALQQTMMFIEHCVALTTPILSSFFSHQTRLMVVSGMNFCSLYVDWLVVQAGIM